MAFAAADFLCVLGSLGRAFDDRFVVPLFLCDVVDLDTGLFSGFGIVGGQGERVMGFFFSPGRGAIFAIFCGVIDYAAISTQGCGAPIVRDLIWGGAPPLTGVTYGVRGVDLLRVFGGVFISAQALRGGVVIRSVVWGRFFRLNERFSVARCV